MTQPTKNPDDYPLRVSGAVTHAAAKWKTGDYILSACGKVGGFTSNLRARMDDPSADVTCGLCRRFLYAHPPEAR